MLRQSPVFKFPRKEMFSVLGSLCLLVLCPGAFLAAPPAGYYDSVDPTSSATLRASLHQVIDGHTRIPYTSSATDTWDVLKLADEDPNDSGKILDLYQNRTFTKQPGGNSYYNREHTWPNSYGFPDDGPSNKPYTDCHHLFLCDIEYNGDRGSRIFDNCLSGCAIRAADDYNGESGNNLTKDASPVGIWETWIGRRGDVARAQFYMDVRYEGDSGEPDLILTDDVNLILASQTGNNEPVAYMGLLEVLVQWHLEDPVDEKEQNRNDWVYAYQGNRNPFIDHPEWVLALFGDFTPVVPDGSPPENLPLVRIEEIFPNPFNPRTRIAFTLTDPGAVRVEIFSLQGRHIRTVLSEPLGSGDHQVFWNGLDERGERAASGTYFCRLISGNLADTRKLMLLK